MNIAFETRSFTNGHAGRGIGVYAKCLYDALLKYYPDNTYIPFNGKPLTDKNIDIVHYPSFEPFFVALPIKLSQPFVVTIHDLTPIALPKLFPLGVKGRIKWEIQRNLVRGATRIITDSLQSKQDVAKYCGYPSDAIDPIYLAPREAFTKKTGKKQTIPEGFPEQYFLYVGDVNRNKNILGLLGAYAQLKQRIHGASIPKLIMVGKALMNTKLPETAEIEATIRTLHLEDDVIRPGFVEDDALVVLYQHAVALIQPSLYEGFGFPVVEAMASGCPVITTNAGSLKEIAGPSITVQPDSHSLADGMKRIVQLTATERKEMVAQGFSWVAQYSWKRVATETMETYNKAIIKR